jgi:hypothetical protein
VDLAWADYEGEDTRFVPYWEKSPLYAIQPPQVLGSLYLKRDRALLVLGSQTEETVPCEIAVTELLKQLPPGTPARDAITGEGLAMKEGPVLSNAEGTLTFDLPGRSWRLIEWKAR